MNHAGRRWSNTKMLAFVPRHAERLATTRNDVFTRHFTEPAVPLNRAVLFMPARRSARALAALLAVAFLAGVVTLANPAPGEAAALPAGFQESIAIGGLT